MGFLKPNGARPDVSKTWWWMQPESNLSSPSNSLLAGNLAGNFLKKGPTRAILVSKTRAVSTAYNQIPCATEQGIILPLTSASEI
jgi:hypothetical protein